MSTSDYDELKSDLRRMVGSGDVRGALKRLNSATPHRFTGMYRFEDPMHKNLYMVDKLDPDVESVDDVPVTATYCAFARKRKRSLTITDSLEDARFADHPARKEVRSYCGVPLVDSRGDVFGTICHFDYGVVDISEETVRLLEDMAPLLENTSNS